MNVANKPLIGSMEESYPGKNSYQMEETIYQPPGYQSDIVRQNFNQKNIMSFKYG